MKKIASIVVLFAFALLLFLWLSQQTNEYVEGRLISAKGIGKYSAGSFQIEWQGKYPEETRLRIYHQDNPTKILFESIQGESFIAAGLLDQSSTLKVIHDNPKIVDLCSNQVVGTVQQLRNKVRFIGTLNCESGKNIPYKFDLTVFSEQQLQFEFSLADAKYNLTYLSYLSHNKEFFYGFGNQNQFNLKGEIVPIYLTEPLYRSFHTLPLYHQFISLFQKKQTSSTIRVPHYITNTLNSLFLENLEPSIFNLSQSDRVQIKLFSKQMKGHILYGESPLDLIEEYTTYSGRTQTTPTWLSDGIMLILEGGTNPILTSVEALQNLGVPISSILIPDWVGTHANAFGNHLWWNWELDTELYSNWETLKNRLAGDQIRLIAQINPYLRDVSSKQNHRINYFKQAEEKNYLVKKKNGQVYFNDFGPFSAALIDLSNPEAGKWYQRILQKEIIDVGFHGWLAGFGGGLPENGQLFYAKPLSYHHQFSVEWAKLNQEVVEKRKQENGNVFLSETAYSKSPRYNYSILQRDQYVNWDQQNGFKSTVMKTLNSGLSGFSLYSSVTGGSFIPPSFFQKQLRTKELLMRWIEFSAFTPIFSIKKEQNQSHHQYDTDQETLDHFLKFSQIYKSLAVYRKILIEEASETGHPVLRHPFIHFPNDPEFQLMDYQQFMLGPDFMIKPIVEPNQKEAMVYLPVGKWIGLWDNKIYENVSKGSYIQQATPLGAPPVFYRENSKVGQVLFEQLKAKGLL